MRKLAVLASACLFMAAAPFAASAAPVSQGEGLKAAAGGASIVEHVQHSRYWSRRRHWRWGSGGHRRWGSRHGHSRYWSARRHLRWGSRRW